jgi:glucose/arabinose dehydrogenase
MGLLGLALDPDFVVNHYVYLYYSEGQGGSSTRNRVVRFTDVGGTGTDMQVVLDDLPIGKKHVVGSHNGGRLGFGPDRTLYITLGDTGERGLVQKKDTLVGKVLRINRDGSIPADNPSPDSPLYALGLRNPWGLGFHPLSGAAYVTDNGPDGYDEINRIEAAGNYGWPERLGTHKHQRFIDPLWESGEDAEAVTGLTFYTGDLFPEYKHDLLFCTFTNGHLRRLRLKGRQYTEIDAEQLLSDQCHLDVATGPEGAIYVSSINKIHRLLPPD